MVAVAMETTITRKSF